MRILGNNLLIMFLVFSFLFFVVALLVKEFVLSDSEMEVQQNGTSGGSYGKEDAADSPATTSASGTARGDHLTLSNRQLRLVSTTWPPFTNAPGKPRFALDLVDVALERMGITAQTVIMDETRLTSVLLSGTFDGSAAVWKNEERERTMIYSQPYLENRLILVGRQGSDMSAISLADLAGTRVALVAGHAYIDVVETTDGPIFVRSNSEEDSVTRLLSGEVDYTLMDDLVIQYLISNHGEETRTRLAFGSTPLLTRSLHLAVRRSLPDADSLVSRFNAELHSMISDRTYHRLLFLDWIRADVDSDGLGEYVPFVDQTGPVPPAHFYELFASGRPSGEPGTTQRYYLGGNIYEGWSAVPEQYKDREFSRPETRLHPFQTFTFAW